MVDGMDGGMICVSTYKYSSKSESKGSHISISVDSWEYTGNESSVCVMTLHGVQIKTLTCMHIHKTRFDKTCSTFKFFILRQ